MLRRRTVYDNPWLRIHQDDIQLPDGTVIDGHHVVDVPRPAVGVIPVGGNGRLLLIEHYRFITDTTGWEIPAGGMDGGEDIFAAAARELLEETGHTADQFESLGNYFPSNGNSNQQFNLLIARGIKQVGQIIDTNEVIQTRWFEADEVWSMLETNRIRDGMSLTALLWYFARHFHGGQPPR